jgi:hypothetical protein
MPCGLPDAYDETGTIIAIFCTITINSRRFTPIRFHGWQLIAVAILQLFTRAHATTFTDANWTTVGAVSGSTVNALAVIGGDLYVGGHFSTAGGAAVANIARWDGTNWSTLGSGLGTVHALAASGADLYAVGQFTSAGGTPANYVAKWNGANWSNLGTGLPADAFAIAVCSNGVYAGGGFNVASDGTNMNCIGKWDGANWTMLPGMGGSETVVVTALAMHDENLYAAGSFKRAGGIPVNSVARWDGTNWSPLGGGLTRGIGSAQVNALVVSGSDLYAAGYFTMADGLPATNIAKWNGSVWTSLGSGLNDQGIALAVSGNNLYAAGPFTTAGGIAANGMAKWDGTNWSALGSGLSGGYPVGTVLAVIGSDLYAGGTFTTAGGKPASHIARAYLPALPMLSIVPAGNAIRLSWPSPDTDAFIVEELDPLAISPKWTAFASTINDDGTNKYLVAPGTNSAHLFRLKK